MVQGDVHDACFVFAVWGLCAPALQSTTCSVRARAFHLGRGSLRIVHVSGSRPAARVRGAAVLVERGRRARRRGRKLFR